MMFESPGRYPLAAKYIRDELPKVIAVHRITQNMRSYGKLTDAEFKAALDPYQVPFLMIGCAGRINSSENQLVGWDQNWMIKCDDPRYIYLETDIITTFEYAGTQSASSVYATKVFTLVPGKRGQPKQTKSVHVLGANILSALVDWGVYTKTGAIEPSASMNFQRAVYGRLIRDGS